MTRSRQAPDPAAHAEPPRSPIHNYCQYLGTRRQRGLRALSRHFLDERADARSRTSSAACESR
jgi:uncharacterized protein YjiS (DUF1127 family)